MARSPDHPIQGSTHDPPPSSNRSNRPSAAGHINGNLSSPHGRQAVGLEPPAASAFPVAPPASGPTETVTLFVADDAAGMLRARAAQIPLPGGRQRRAEELLRALLRIYQQPGAAHPLAPAADIRSIYLVDPGAAVIDLNAA